MRRLLLGLLVTVAAGAQGPTPAEREQITAAAPATAPAQPARPRRVLIVSANAGFNHTAIPFGAAAFEILGLKSGAYTSVHLADAAGLTAEALAGVDAVIVNNGYQFKLAPEQQLALWRYVAEGGGLVGLHAASANFEGWPEGSLLFGARFREHPWTPKAEWAFRLDEPDHPLNAAFGGQGFRLRDEIYAFDGFDPARSRLLVSLDLDDPAVAAEPHRDTLVPVSWVQRHGRGRVFFCSLGHEHAIFWTPAVLAHWLAGVQYAVGDLVVDDRPDPAITVTPLRQASFEEAQPALAALETRLRVDPDPALEAPLLALLVSEAPLGVRLRVADAVRAVASPAAIEVVTPLLAHPQLGAPARGILVAVGTPEADAALRAALAGATGPARIGLVTALGDRGDRRAAAAIAALAADADAELADAAVRALGRIGDIAALARLAPSPAVDAARIEAARRAGDAESVAGLVAGERPAATRIAAATLVTELRSPRAGAMLAGLLTDADEPVARAAARLIGRLPLDQPLPALDGPFAATTPAVRALVLAALAERRDPAGAALAVASLAAADDELRRAAVVACGALAGPEAIGPLARLAVDASRADRAAIRDALARLPGAGVDEALTRWAAAGEPAQRAPVMAPLADRGVVAAGPLLLRLAGEPEPLGSAAVEALGRLAGVEAAAPVAALTARTLDGTVRAVGGEALVRLAERVPDREVVAAAMADVLTADAPGRAVLLAALASIGGETALAALQAAAPTDEAALVALAETWAESSGLPLLRDLAGAAPTPSLRIVALRGYLRLIGGQPAEVLVPGAEAALGLATRAEERRGVLAALRGCPAPGAVTLAARLLDDPELTAEAVDCVIHLTGTVTGPEAEAALARVAAIRDRDLPAGWHAHDVGAVNPRGAVATDGGTYVLQAAGADIWNAADGCLLVARTVTGDATIIARVESIERTDGWAKAGVMFRESTAAGARNVYLGVSPANGGTFQWRATADGPSEYQAPGGEVAPPHWVKLQRVGDEFIAWLSPDGVTWREVGRRTVAMPAELQVGLAVTSHNAGAATTARIGDVTLETGEAR